MSDPLPGSRALSAVTGAAEFQRDTLVRMLHRLGFSAVSEVRGRAALRRLRQDRGRTKIIVSDIMMPDMDGLELIRELREGWPDLRIIAVSSGGELVQMNLSAAARIFGADRMLAKPCSGEAIAAAIAASLAQPPRASLVSPPTLEP